MFLRRRTIPWFLGSAVFTIAAFSALVVSADSPSSGEISSMMTMMMKKILPR
jgi:hypothetical protein